MNHYHAAQCLTIAGTDIYHPSQDELTGAEIAFGGDMTRSLKNDNYLVLETEAQGFPGWTPYRGQLRLQAYSHLASGANSVMYWHWHSIHNSFETYWKGLLSHDLQENETYREACVIGREFKEHGSHLVNLKKKNEVAILASFKTGFANEHVKVSHEIQPHLLNDCFGIKYHQFTFPRQVGLTGTVNGVQIRGEAKVFMELLIPEGASVLAAYEHYNWKEYAAVTKNSYGKGTAIYLGCMTDEETLGLILEDALREAQIEPPVCHFPVIIRKGTNDFDNKVTYFLNYSEHEQELPCSYQTGKELLTGKTLPSEEILRIPPWGVRIIEERTVQQVEVFTAETVRK